MEKNVEILELLMSSKKEKKKKNPNAKEKEAFRNAWVSLAVENGFSRYAEQLLYEGFSFCGAEPFYSYLIKTEDQTATLLALFNGNYYGKDSNVTFRLEMHLLALALNDNAPRTVLAPIIERLPVSSINKDKKRLGTAEKTVEKYYLAELKPDVTLYPLSYIGTKPIFVKEFIDLLSSVLDAIETSGSSKRIVADNIIKTRKWFSDYELSQSVSLEKTAPVVASKRVDISNNTAEQPEETAKLQITPNTLPDEDTPVDTATCLISLLSKASKAAIAVKSETAQQKIRINALVESLDGEQKKIRMANQQIAEQQDSIAALRARISSLEGDTVVLQQELAARDVDIAEKAAEVEERIKMADVLSRDRNNQSNETLQRLASKIRVEYRDFKDALDVPMSCDLGENMRLQLQSIFDILEKGGMKIK